MSDDTITIGGDSADIPAGTYEARLHAITTKTSDAFGEFRAWDFALGLHGTIVGGASSMNTGSKSKGGKWIAALLGRVPAKGEVISLKDLLERPCLVTVVEDANGWPKVDNVLPAMKSNTPAVETAAADPVTPAATPSAAGVTVVPDLPF